MQISAQVRDAARGEGSQPPRWYETALMVLAVVALGVATQGTPRPSPFEPTWDSFHRAGHPEAVVGGAAPNARTSGERVLASDVVRRRRALVPQAIEAFRRDCDTTPWRYGLPGYTFDRTEAFVRGAVDVRDHQDALLRATLCDAEGCVIDPPLSVLEALSPASRERIYAELERHSVNVRVTRSHRRRVLDGPFSRMPDMPPAAAPWLDRVQYTARGAYFLVDLEVVCAHLDSVADRAAFLRALNGRTTVDAALRVSVSGEALRNSLPPALVAPALAALQRARATGESELPVEALLPDAVRRRLGRFPTPSELDVNCFSSALSFRGGDVRGVTTTEAVRAELQRGYQRVDDGSLRLGDLMLFEDARGEAVHAVIYLLDSLVYTKNGFGPFEPWRVLELADVEVVYPESAGVSVWRALE